MKPTQGRRNDVGIECPACGCRHFQVTHTEPLRDGRIRRRKVCRYCGKKVLTYETAATMWAREDNDGNQTG
jgi:transcriptional regulator NrdR family protein